MGKTAFIFPGQGAQFPGMGKSYFDAYSEAKLIFEEADDILKRNLTKLLFEGSAEELTLTNNSQVAIFVTSIAMLQTLKQKPDVCAGLSLGEYSAITATGMVSFADLLPVVALRGEAMQRAAIAHPGAMAVVLGLAEFNVPEGVWVANLNCPGQVVISGTKEGITSATESIKAQGAKRVLPLDVSGAFHSGLMQDARDELKDRLSSLHIAKSDIDLVMNVPGDYVKDPEEIRANLIRQVTEPVLWEKGMRAMVDAGATTFIEIGPGKTLCGMGKKICPDRKLLTVEDIINA